MPARSPRPKSRPTGPMCAIAPGSKDMRSTFRRTVGGRSNPDGADQRTRLECWGATSADGNWRFEKVETTPTLWCIIPADLAIAELVPEIGSLCGSFDSARRSVASGWADLALAKLLNQHFAEADRAAA